MNQVTAHNFARHTRRNHRVAFTLLEVIVAMAIVAMIAAALAAAMTVAFKAKTSAMNSLANVRQARLAMEVIGNDLQTALPPTGILAGAFMATPDDPSENFDLLEFYNTADMGQSIDGTADVQKVALRVMPESELLTAVVDQDLKDPRDQGMRLAPSAETDNDSMVLVRRVTRRLLAQVTPEPAYQIVVRHVQAFEVRVYDGQDWLDTWDSTTLQNTLPVAVQITLQIKQPATAAQLAKGVEPKMYVMTRIFQLPCHAAADSTSQQDGSQDNQSRTQ